MSAAPRLRQLLVQRQAGWRSLGQRAPSAGRGSARRGELRSAAAAAAWRVLRSTAGHTPASR
eukprot:7227840-Alexandrium_andersonii.AAC.1